MAPFDMPLAESPAAAWSALPRALDHDAAARVPLHVDGEVVGSVARAHLGVLREFAPALSVHDDAVHLCVSPAQRDVALDAINRALHERGLICAWRDETYPLPDARGTGSLARIERAASRFWGTLSFGAHATGYVADAAGRPTHLWIAQRAFDKATDPGLFDNLIGGGVPHGQTPLQALQREGWEEAGLPARTLRGARAGSVLRLCRDIAEGLQHEWLYSYELQLPDTLVPCNQDGEVARFDKLPLHEALQLAAGETMTVDAALVTLDFALRHRLLPADQASRLEAGFERLRVHPPGPCGPQRR